MLFNNIIYTHHKPPAAAAESCPVFVAASTLSSSSSFPFLSVFAAVLLFLLVSLYFTVVTDFWLKEDASKYVSLFHLYLSLWVYWVFACCPFLSLQDAFRIWKFFKFDCFILITVMGFSEFQSLGWLVQLFKSKYVHLLLPSKALLCLWKLTVWN